MRLTFIGSTSDVGTCPTLYETDRGTYSVRGWQVTDPEALADLRHMLDGETSVEIPRELLRVRVVADPLTDYQRYGVWSSQVNIAAGEDIRYLGRDQANALDLPGHDFWVFDSEQVALLYFRADHRFVGFHLLTEAAIVRQHERWLDTAFRHAVRYEAYLAQTGATVRRPNDA